jgi:hypothetical protein
VPSGGFDGSSSEWVQQATSKYVTTRASLDSANCASSGSLLYTNTGPDTTDIPIGSPCFPISASSTYNMGAWVYIPASAPGGIGPWPYAFVAIAWYTDTGCSSSTGASLGIGPSAGVLDAWQYIHQEGVVPPAGTKAGKFLVGAYGNSAGFAQAYFDSLYFTPAPGRF